MTISSRMSQTTLGWKILKDRLSMVAIGRSKCRVFFLPQNNKNPQSWAPILNIRMD